MRISLGELAIRYGCDLDGDPDTAIDGVSSLTEAIPGKLSFLANPKLTPQLKATRASAVVLRAEDAQHAPCAALLADNPYATFARIAQELHPPPPVSPGIHAAAVVHETAHVTPTAEISAGAYIGERAVIGEHAYVGPGAVVGPACRLGDHSRLLANVTLVRAVAIGQRCLIHPGAVLGSDGFGNAMSEDGWVKVPQIGGVRIGDDVEIGANTTIDCGTLGDTIIEEGVRIDNLCHFAHNVRIGAHTAIAAQTGFAGSAIVGKRCLFAGQSGSVGHITICDDAIISGKGMITKSITKPGVYASSFPSEPAKKWNRLVANVRRIDTLFERVKALEKNDT
ncbi:MAG TPA: UDP-3-O-(3-hydroxymyristoyl)glucosamine N-acyltransferase [Woeseiaceae bacterium]|nr:UDP-3-O-(3-hydroxymyristoyl)glucosamine N-acyltransferase [Woeseiaceae bacterium]